MTPQREEAMRLLRLARRDKETFDLLAPMPQASVEALGFHAQQAVEKSLKAVAVLHGLVPHRTHDLVALALPIAAHGLVLPVSDDDLRALNPFAVEFRYDDDVAATLGRSDLAKTLSTVFDWAALLVGA